MTRKESQPHASKQEGEEKLHGDALEEAVSSAGEHDTSERQSAIPAADKGGHARSQAAHLGGHVHDHTKPVGDLRKYEAEREPPQEVSRAGKDYRRQ
ncbi:MAG TPA: hypothetical protein VGM11_03120 [Acidobacteriaceae bacterium]|jgi:hypothetical protein